MALTKVDLKALLMMSKRIAGSAPRERKPPSEKLNSRLKTVYSASTSLPEVTAKAAP